MERPDAPVPLVRVGGSNRRTAVSITVAVVLVVAAIAKPWAGPATRPSVGAPIVGLASGSAAAAAVRGVQSRGDPGARQASVVPTLADGAAGDPLAIRATVNRLARADPCCTTPGAAVLVEEGGMPICYAPDGWRVVADEEAAGIKSRVWIPVAARAAAGPGDPRVQLVRLVASRVTALGFCAPVDRGSHGGWAAVLWQATHTRDASGTVYVPVAALRTFGSADGALVSAATRRAAWPVGRYVLQVQSGVAATHDSWFGLDLEAPTP